LGQPAGDVGGVAGVEAAVPAAHDVDPMRHARTSRRQSSPWVLAGLAWPSQAGHQGWIKSLLADDSRGQRRAMTQGVRHAVPWRDASRAGGESRPPGMGRGASWRLDILPERNAASWVSRTVSPARRHASMVVKSAYPD